jgi:hypothetical protein
MGDQILKIKGMSARNAIDVMRRNRIVMPKRARTTIVPPEDVLDTVRKVVEYTDYPVETAGGHKLIRRVEKVLMPNGSYRYPETYIDINPSFVVAQEDWDKDRVSGYEMEINL